MLFCGFENMEPDVFYCFPNAFVAVDPFYVFPNIDGGAIPSYVLPNIPAGIGLFYFFVSGTAEF